MAQKAADSGNLAPEREDVLAYLREHEGPVDVSEMARAFGAKGKQRTALRQLLRELEDDGLIERSGRRKYASRQRLGAVAVLEITGPDTDGELRARPLRWAEGESPPAIYVAPARGRGPALGAGERILARLGRNDDGSYDAVPMRRLGAAPREIIGVYELIAGRGRIRPTDRRAKYDYGVDPAKSAGAEPGELVRARTLTSRRGGLRGAEILERIGHMESPGAIGLIALHSNAIPIALPEAALAEAAAAAPAGPEDRIDLRDIPLVTIDGEDARDFDDAVYAAPDDGPGSARGWRILIAIADVAWYVRPGTALDDAARLRGNSVYLPDRVVPMLPEALSAGLCSLQPGEDRAVLAVDLRIDAAGNIVAHRFLRGLMRSAARLTYRQVQAIRDGTGAPPDGLSTDVFANLYGAYDALATARAARGTLELELPEYRVELAEGKITGISKCDRLTSHRLIEDFMIAANVAAAETLERRRAPCMYRIHEPPDPAKLAGLREFLDSFGLHLPAGQVVRAGQLAGLLDRAARNASGEIIHEAILRCQAQAAYSPENVGHFGLALRRYAHFTSPIRRYADLLVHRSLISALGLGEGGLAANGGTDFAQTGAHISETERNAQAAEREAVDRYVALYLEERVGSRFTGRITGVTRFGLFVRLGAFGADGLAPASLLGDEHWRHDERGHCLTGMTSGTIYGLGDEVEVELREANPVTGGLLFTITGHQPVPRKHVGSRRRRSRGPGRPARAGKGRGKKRRFPC